MKNFDLNACGVSEMNVAEMQKLDGGILCILIVVGAVVISEFAVGLLEGLCGK